MCRNVSKSTSPPCRLATPPILYAHENFVRRTFQYVHAIRANTTASPFHYKIRLSFAVSPSAVTDSGFNRGHSDKHRYEEAKTKSTLDYCYELYHLDQVQLGEPLSPHCLLYTRPHAVPHPIVCLCTSLAAQTISRAIPNYYRTQLHVRQQVYYPEISLLPSFAPQQETARTIFTMPRHTPPSRAQDYRYKCRSNVLSLMLDIVRFISDRQAL